MKKRIVFFLLAAAAFLSAQEIRSVKEERRDVIRYGIETEIAELLGTLKTEKDVSLVKEIAGLLETNPSGKIQKEIFDYLKDVKRPEGTSAAENLLSRWEDAQPELLASVLGYLAEIESGVAEGRIFPLLEAKNSLIVSAAVRYFGRKKTEGAASRLRDLFDSGDASLQLRGEILLALGEMRDSGSVTFLADLLEDDDEDMTLRRFACDALGKTGDPRALPSIRKAFESNDNILRSYAVSALGRFPGRETVDALAAALRDSFPRVRELAAERLGDLEAGGAVEILVYRARRDPEKRVRQASFRSLAKIGGGDAVKFLQDFLAGERNPVDFRSIAAEELINRRPASAVDPVLRTMEQEWKKDNSALLDAVCKLASQKEFGGFDALYEKMLQHRSFVIQIYGIRGIQKNGVGRLRAPVEEFTKEKYHPQLRRAASAALEDM